MVSIFFPSAAETGKEQLRIAWPSNRTVQAPQVPMPQPYLVPVKPTCSRITHNNGVSGSTSTAYFLPLIFRLAIRYLLWIDPNKNCIVMKALLSLLNRSPTFSGLILINKYDIAVQQSSTCKISS
jgi:hypothetical protein